MESSKVIKPKLILLLLRINPFMNPFFKLNQRITRALLRLEQICVARIKNSLQITTVAVNNSDTKLYQDIFTVHY